MLTTQEILTFHLLQNWRDVNNISVYADWLYENGKDDKPYRELVEATKNGRKFTTPRAKNLILYCVVYKDKLIQLTTSGKIYQYNYDWNNEVAIEYNIKNNTWIEF